MKKKKQLLDLLSYVDSQLRHSKRFDVAGMQEEYPEFFMPLPKRRTASSTSLPPMMSDSPIWTRTFTDEGQLRYWTSEMCSKNPHWFDFVVTVRGFFFPFPQAFLSLASCPISSRFD